MLPGIFHVYYRYNDRHIFSKLPFTTQINMGAVTVANDKIWQVQT